MTKKFFRGITVVLALSVAITIAVPESLIYAVESTEGAKDATVSETANNTITQDTADEAVPADTETDTNNGSRTTTTVVGGQPALVACYCGPLELTASSTTGFDISFHLSDKNDSSDPFTLERMSDGSLFASVASIPSSAEYFTDGGLTPGKTYTYRISRPGAHSNLVNVKTLMLGDANGDGQISTADYTLIDAGFSGGGTTWAQGDFKDDNVVDFDDYALTDLGYNTQVPTPANLQASAQSGFTIQLTWDSGMAFATGTTAFSVERMAAGGSWAQVAVLPFVGNPTWTDTTVTPGTSYFYRVQSYTATETSAYSNFVNVMSLAIGDTNGDAMIDQTDYNNINNGFTTQTVDWAHGEFDLNGVIDFDDFVLIDQAYNTCKAGTANAVPTLSIVPTEESVTKDAAYNPLHGVTANDTEDGDLTASVIVNGSVDIHTLGDYVLTYMVSDSDAQSVVGNRTVHVVAPTENGGGNQGNNGGGSQGFTGGGSGSVLGTLGQVLGASTGPSSCGTYLTQYIKFGAQNDIYNVALLQIFLNNEMKAGLPLDGFYGTTARDFVNAFQVKYAAEVLRPWVAFGLPSETTPTGFVYKTTARMVNQIACGITLPMPMIP